MLKETEETIGFSVTVLWLIGISIGGGQPWLRIGYAYAFSSTGKSRTAATNQPRHSLSKQLFTEVSQNDVETVV